MFNHIPTFVPPRFGHIRHIHFVGIGGAGMCGIAEVLHNLGYTVSGSDKSENYNTRRLRTLGVPIQIGHAAEHVAAVDVVVVSTIIDESNIEIVAAKLRGVPVIRRAEMLAELMRLQHGIAIAGTHGKTTTTSLVTSLFCEAELDPTYVIGGKLNSSGRNAKLGTSAFFIAEADESDASFLLLQPMVAVVTNIDADHMETYQGDFNKLRQAFFDFLHRLPFYGLAILCRDDPIIAGMLKDIPRPFLTYGFHEEADYRATDWQQVGTHCVFHCLRPAPHAPLDIQLNMLGQHNVLNALAAIAVATEHGVSDQAILSALAKFAGVGRRIQQHGAFKLPQGEILLLDDYGHHPSELSVTFDAIRAAWPNRRLVSIFQPHRYSRTAALLGDFASVLSRVDVLFLMEIYSAGEPVIQGINSELLLEAVRKKGLKQGFYLPSSSLADTKDTVLDVLCDQDILLLQGAGDIGACCTSLADYLNTLVIESSTTESS